MDKDLERAMQLGLLEDKKFLDIAKDYRSLSFTQFQDKYWYELVEHASDRKWWENIDAALEILVWTS